MQNTDENLKLHHQAVMHAYVCMLNQFGRVQHFGTLCTFVHDILQVRILEWVAVASFRGSC